MKGKLLTLLLLAGISAFAGARVYVGVQIGNPAPPPVVVYAPPPPVPRVAYVPPQPGPGYAWVAEYWYPMGGRWVWRAGFWAHQPFGHARWVAPDYGHGRYYGGYWRR